MTHDTKSLTFPEAWRWLWTFNLPAIIANILSPPTPPTATIACNGNPVYCTRRYSNITQIGAHDSPFVGPLLQQNQNIDVARQLNLGVRFLQAQTHRSPRTGRLELCHTSCLLEDAGSLEGFLVTVREWLERDENANEVVTLLLTNGDRVDLGLFDEAFDRSGIKKYAFRPGVASIMGIEEWPTLMELIENGTRLVVFLDYGATGAIIATPPSPYDYILDEFGYFFESPFDMTDPALDDCSVNRPPAASPTGRMYIVNHFLDVDVFGVLIPDRVNAARTNAVSGYGSIGAHCDKCLSIYGRPPNVVLVDFVDQGRVIEAQSLLNGVSSGGSSSGLEEYFGGHCFDLILFFFFIFSFLLSCFAFFTFYLVKGSRCRRLSKLDNMMPSC